MANEVADKKFTWVIQNFSSLQSKTMFSNKFVIGGCKWVLVAYPRKLENANYLSLFLMVAELQTLPWGWRCYARSRLTIVNQLSKCREEMQCWFDENIYCHEYQEMISLNQLNSKESGSLVNNKVKIVVEVDVLQVIGNLDVSEKSQEVTQPLKRRKLNGDGSVVSSHLHKETSSVDVNGFHLLPSQVESVKRIFEKHPDMALEFRAKNQHMRTLCINLLLNIIETLCQPLQDVSIDDLSQAKKALTYLKDSGFKVDWLECKLEEVKEKKMEEQIGKTQMQELEEELKVFKQKCSDKEALLEKEKEELKDLKRKCSDKEALLEKEKEELKDLKQKCSDTEALLEKEKTKVVATIRAPPLTLDDVV